MRFVVISDIQGNLPALQSVLEAVDGEENIERVVCAGDLVGLGAYPNEVIDLVRQRDVAAIQGNYDTGVVWDGTGSGMDFATTADELADAAAVEWTRSQLSEENMSYLRGLPRDLRLEHGARIRVRKDSLDDRTSEYRRTFFVRALFGGLATSRAPVSNLKSIVVVHGSPRASNEFVRESTAASILKSVAENANGDVVISGHARESFSRELGNTTFVGVGPVDSTLVGGGAAEYVVVDVVGSMKVEFRSSPYDVESYRRSLDQAGLPRFSLPTPHF
jgi:predicted phosphodiesterase